LVRGLAFLEERKEIFEGLVSRIEEQESNSHEIYSHDYFTEGAGEEN
jgi:hypothetical protein